MICISNVLFIADLNNIQTVLKKLVDNISLPQGIDRGALYEALLAREELMTTAIGKGFAIPHVRKYKSDVIKEDIVVFAYLFQPIDWHAPDGQPVNTLFFLLAQDETHHLKILSEIARLTSDESFVEFLQRMPDQDSLQKRIQTMQNQM